MEIPGQISAEIDSRDLYAPPFVAVVIILTPNDPHRHHRRRLLGQRDRASKGLGVIRIAINRNPRLPGRDDDKKDEPTPMKRDAFKDGCLTTIRNGRSRPGKWCWATP
jgi:hypothetical protein